MLYKTGQCYDIEPFMNEELQKIRHSASHVLAAAVLRLFPEAKLDIGPATEGGFYYDFDLEHKFTAEDLEKIEAEMKKIIAENQKFEMRELTRAEAETLIRERGQEAYKLGRLADVPEGEKITFYTNGEFCDLCAGPHVDYSKRIKAFKLLSVAGAYHRGDEKNRQLQRIYGTAFESKAELEAYLAQQEEAKKRDHRKLGREMGLFAIDDKVGQGLILWKPRAPSCARLSRTSYWSFCASRATRRSLPRTSESSAFSRPAATSPTTRNPSSCPSWSATTSSAWPQRTSRCRNLRRKSRAGPFRAFF